ncbi:MAG: hypothetical protein R2718_01385 [Solirubrobacterales bacterium]|nr:hypothetical protein [Solirubrobacterales bacterium]
MADHRGPEPPEPRVPGDRPRPAAEAPAFDLAAALSDLDRATRSFAERLGAQRDADLAAVAATGFARQPAAPAAAPASSARGRDAFEERMREAEREAGEYLEHAKRRADSLVNAMVGAVEREAAEMRREAEVGIRARWQAVEVDAARHVDEARKVAERMVAERQQRIAALSDGITGRAQALTAGMEDAQRVRRQFETFVRALSSAADRIATAREPAGPAPAGGRDDGRRTSAIAA